MLHQYHFAKHCISFWALILNIVLSLACNGEMHYKQKRGLGSYKVCMICFFAH